jgi:SulP family sulfate permease
VNVGVILSALLFMGRMAQSVDIEREDHGTRVAVQPGGAAGDVLVYSIDGPLFFGAAERLERTLGTIQRPATTVILRMGEVPFVDATGLLALEDMIKNFRRRGSTIVLAEVRDNVRFKLERAGILRELAPDDLVPDLDSALARAAVLASTRAAA